jgi:hypothetical protein
MTENPAYQLRAPTWARRGLLVDAPPARPWSHSHAALPALEQLDDGRLELYYSPRDTRGRAHIARAQLAIAPTGELSVTATDREPVLRPGALGAFDDSGVTMSCIAKAEVGTLLFYTGWTLGVTVPFYFYAGLALRAPGDRVFRRVSAAPLLERNPEDAYLTASPWVLNDDGTWRMWYVSCTRWEMHADGPRHYYNLRYADSEDGIHWRRSARPAIDFADDDEYAISRPCVVREDGRYRMWFAARGDSYRLGYAESVDAVNWERDDTQAGLLPAQDGWDSEMLAYPVVYELDERKYLLYNGNGYGRSGIGYATADTEA